MIITALAGIVAIPVGLMTAVYLVEYGRGRLPRAITFFVDVMTGIPSIVAGLVRLRAVRAVRAVGAHDPGRGALDRGDAQDRAERAARGVVRPRRAEVITKVVIPTAIAGIASGITLAIARVIGETAPLLIAVGVTTGVNLNPFDSRMATLRCSPTTPTSPRACRASPSSTAWTAALVLIILVMVLNIVARLIARLFASKTAGR